MRLITLEEQIEILKCLTHAEFWSDMMKIDAICYGGDTRQYEEQRQYAARVIGAFPKDIREEFNASLRKIEADKLRNKANLIERGEA